MSAPWIQIETDVDRLAEIRAAVSEVIKSDNSDQVKIAALDVLNTAAVVGNIDITGNTISR